MIFNYIAVSSTGQRITGSREASTKEEVVNYLQTKSLTVISVDEQIGLQWKRLLSADIGGLPLKEKLVLMKQLSTMVSANIPIIQAMDILVQQAEKPSIKNKLQNIYKSIESGMSLADSFKKEKGMFSEVHLNLISAGEKSANLGEMLLKVTDDLEKSRNLRGKIVGAMIYPIIIFVVLIGVVIIMLTSMVPQVKELYQSLGSNELPFATQALVNLGDLFSNPTGLLGIVFVILAFLGIFQYAKSTPKGAETIDKITLKIPIFGNLLQKSELGQFCRVLSMLLKSGLQILEAIDVSSTAANSKLVKNIILNSKEDVIKGSPLSIALAKSDKNGVIPIILLKIIATGEESGKLDQVLEDMGKFYEDEVDQIASNLTKLLEPLIMIVAGGLVAFLAIAIYLPIFQAGQLVQT